jgi:hypothetical protein
VSSSSAKTDYAAKGYTKAKVIRYDVDGCKWLLQLEDGKKLIPSLTLAEDFAVDGKSVWITYTIQKSGVSTCMAGMLVTITAIEKRD